MRTLILARTVASPSDSISKMIRKKDALANRCDELLDRGDPISLQEAARIEIELDSLSNIIAHLRGAEIA